MTMSREGRFRRTAQPAGPGGRRGQALVEFAFVLPILVLLIMGIFEFGRAYNAYEVVTDAAREAARQAAVDDNITVDSVRAVALAALQRAGLQTADSMVSVTDPDSVGDPTSVEINYPFNFLFLGPLLDWTTGQSQVVLSSTSIMRHE